MSWDALTWYEKLGVLILAFGVLELAGGVCLTLFQIFCDFCDAVNHRIKYGSGVVLPEPKGDPDE